MAFENIPMESASNPRINCLCGHYHDGDVCDDCPCRIYRAQGGDDRAVIEADIKFVSEQLKGPLSNGERAFLYMERSDLRRALAELNSGIPTSKPNEHEFIANAYGLCQTCGEKPKAHKPAPAGQTS